MIPPISNCMANVNEILTLIEETKQDSRYDVYIPSKGETFKLLPLNANDQKNLVKALVDSPIYSNETNVKFGQMISTILPEELTINELTTFDRIFIAIAVRIENIQDDYKFNLKDDEDAPFEKTISLSKHMEKVGKVKHPDATDVEVGDCKSTLSVPSIAQDLEFEMYLAQAASQIKNNDEKGLRGMISTFYMINILRYIETLTIKETEIPFRTLPLGEKIQIGQSLLSKFTREVVSVIDSHFGKEAMDAITIKFTKDGKDYEEAISIDNTFFMAS